jgi:long-chain acyl-CoA synthetase
MSFKLSLPGALQRIIDAHGSHPTSSDLSQPDDPAPSPVNQPELPYEFEYTPGLPTRVYMDRETGLKTTETKGAPAIPDSETIYDIYRHRAERMPNDPLYCFRDANGSWVSKTGAQTLSDIRRTAKGFLHLGVRKGEGVALMSKTSYAWDLVDAGVVSIGGILATVYDTDSTEQIARIIDNADVRIIVVQTEEMRQKAEVAVGKRSNIRIYCLDQGDLEAIQAYGETVSDQELDERIKSIRSSDLCSVVYTSGSTALPKGVEMRHINYCATAENLRVFFPNFLGDKSGSILQFLPQAHSFARAINYICVNSNMRIYISDSFRSLLPDLQVARPTVMIGVPRVFEKIYNAASQKSGNGVKGHVFMAAANTAREYMHEVAHNGQASRGITALRNAFDPIVYKQLRDVLGGRAKWLVCGGAPLDPALMNFFRGANIPLYEGYGLTETTAPCAFTPFDTPYHEGSVGFAFPGFALRISKIGELEVKGTACFTAYHKNPAATRDSFTKDGWYKTGDLGRIDNDGYVYITGRIKDLIITAGGKNVSPGPMEEVIERCPIVSNALVLGDKRPFVSALVTLDASALRGWLKSKGLDDRMSVAEAAENAAVRAEVQDYVDKANEGESRAESVRKFIILPEDFTQENGLMTASMKVIRPRVISHYSKLLATRMYVPRKHSE